MENLSIEKSLLQKTNLDWKVKVEKLYTGTGLETDNIAIIREDTNKILGVHTTNYTPFQNEEMMEVIVKLSQRMELPIQRGGFFDDGRLVFIQLKSNEIKLGNDVVKGFITGVNSFDGTTSLAFGPSNLTISCRNKFYANYKSLANKVRHTSKMHDQVEMILKNMDQVLRNEQVVFEQIKKMSEVRISNDVRELVIGMLLNLDKEEKLADRSTLSTRKNNILTTLELDIEDQIKDKGDNIWGLFSGITKFTTHSISGDSDAKIFNTYGRREREIFSTLGSLIEA